MSTPVPPPPPASQPPAPQAPALQAPARPRRVYVSFSAEVTPHTTESLIAAASNCANQRFEEIYLLLSSPGGSVMNGINLYNVLRSLPLKVITHNVGNVNSIANAVFLAGEERYACPHSTFMFHGVGFDLPQGGRLEEKFLREHLAGILSDQKRIGSILEERTKLTKGEVNALFRGAQTKDATYAIGRGIIHEICDVQIAPGDAVIALVFQR